MLNKEAELEKIIFSSFRIPPNPEIMIEVNSKLDSGNYEVASLADQISRDVGMCSMLFRVARSEVFAEGNAPETVEQSISKLGLKLVASLIRATSFLPPLDQETVLAFRKFWTRSAELGRLASLIAKDRIAVCNIFPEQALLIGKFLESGVASLILQKPEYSRFINEQDKNLISVKQEDDLFNIDRVSVGYYVTKHWRLPPIISKVIQSYHNIPSSTTGEESTISAIMHLAHHCHCILGGKINPNWHFVSDQVMNELGIYPGALQEYIDEINDDFHSVDLNI